MEVPRANFDSFLWSSITIFQIMIGDNWTSIMYDGVRAKGPLASVMFVLLFVGGNIIMLNLFLAILLGNFEQSRNYQKKKSVITSFIELKEIK